MAPPDTLFRRIAPYLKKDDFRTSIGALARESPSMSEPQQPPPDQPESAGVGDTVRRTLLVIGEQREIEDRAREISQRLSKLTPLPEVPNAHGKKADGEESPPKNEPAL